jgi:hypothetical protein
MMSLSFSHGLNLFMGNTAHLATSAIANAGGNKFFRFRPQALSGQRRCAILSAQDEASRQAQRGIEAFQVLWLRQSENNLHGVP